MKNFHLKVLGSLSFGFSAFAIQLSDYTPYEYKVHFTNPPCRQYLYPQSIESFSGQLLEAKPQGAFCTSQDIDRSGDRPDSTLVHLLNWIEDPSTREIFFSSFTFSNRELKEAMCRAVTERGVKLRFVLNSSSDQSMADQLLTCQHSSGLKPERVLRGGNGSLGFAHVKLVMINPGTEVVKLAYGSGNLSLSLPIHHENWHFVTTSGQSYFAQKHNCMKEGLLQAGESKRAFRDFLDQCLSQIQAEPEEDIQMYAAPAEGREALDQAVEAVSKSTRIEVAAHRFSNDRLIESLLESAQTGNSIEIIFDDDLFWTAQSGRTVGSNTMDEVRRTRPLEEAGVKFSYIETNHWEKQFQHNKFLIYQNPEEDFKAVFTGAGNLTKAAFSDNFENFYYIQIPEVVEAFKTEYEFLDKLASDREELPRENIKPRTNGELNPRVFEAEDYAPSRANLSY